MILVIVIVIVIMMDNSASTGRSLCLIAGRGAAALGIDIGIGIDIDIDIGAFLAVLTARHLDSIRLIRFDSIRFYSVLCCAVMSAYRVSEVIKYTTLPLLFVSFPIIVLYCMYWISLVKSSLV